MIRWLLNTIPTWALVVLVVGGFMTVAGFGLLFVRRRWPHFIAGEHNDVAGVLLGIVGATYGIMLAFVIVAVYQDFSDAEANVRGEATSLAQVYRDTRGMPIADAMAEPIGQYVHHVVDEEWQLMADGQLSATAGSDIDAMFRILQGYEPQTQSQSSFFDAAIGDINQLVAARRSRLFDAREELPVMLQLLVVGGAVLVVAFTWLFGMRRLTAQLLMVVGVGALIGFSVLIALMIDHPFSGDFSISSAPFREGALAIFWQP
jgi:hypothetical protein